MIQNLRRADHAPSEATDATGQNADFTRPGMKKPQVSGYSDGLEWAGCKTVGLAYVGSNPTPATNYSPQYQQVSAVIRNLVPISTASRSERSARRSL
jgi:hypothetical protein